MSTRSFLEVEAKFAVADSAIVPDLTRLAGVDGVVSATTHHLSAIYYDTEDLRLTRSKITLRRREGGHDAGWHIKLPGSAGRVEIQAPMGEPVDGFYQVPEDLLSEVRALVRGKPLAPIAQVDNARVESTLAGANGSPVAEFCDDHVTAWSLLPGGTQSSWREWEIELAGETTGTELGTDLMTSATALLLSAGARVSSSPSKLVMALGDSANNAPLPPFQVEPDIAGDSPAAAVIAALTLNRDKLLKYDPIVRRDEWDSIHQMRVATRELRSHIETFNGILGGQELEYIESELKLLAKMLGHARDAEVVEERFLSLLDSEDSGVLDEDTKEHLRHDMGAEYRRAHRRVIATLNSERYLDLLDAIDHLLAHPPVVTIAPTAIEPEPEAGPESQSEPESDSADVASTDTSEATVEDEATPASDVEETAEETEEQAPSEQTAATEPEKAGEAEPAHASSQSPAQVEELLSEHLDEAYKKLRKRHRKAVKNWSNRELSLHEREDFFHDMRKSAKKLRYAAEAVGAATELKTKRLYNSCKAMQSSLGDFQDSVTSRDRLLQLADHAHRRGEDTFGYGVLYQRERMIGLRALDDYAKEAEAIEAAYARLLKSLKNSRKGKGKKKSKKK
ncbi:CHAD domain-containing protein [Corynebacterium alimapuense]|uniref:Metal-chelation protein CHAD n=1 Tax=Corynebacterium alimapuense TaxID=1576874 RepID=A0A3M8K9I2_9CORY|nr:CHAD domain-containing protein [Corynebacterium alimapuense]RNE49549.1 metal-chelation protein CHAD [Corynebacterium alimapuense]